MNRDEQLDIINNVWPLISDQDVAALEERLVDMPHLAGASAQCPQVLTHSARPMASACIAHLACGTRVFIKRYAPHLISEYDLCVKHDYVNRLAAGAFPTPRFFTFDTGRTCLTMGGWVWEVSECAPGEDRYRATTSWMPPCTREESVEIGRVAGQLRRASEKIPAVVAPPNPYQSRMDLMLGDPFDRLEAWCKAHPIVANYVSRTGRDLAGDLAVVAPFARALEPLRERPRYWTHGDLHVSNTMWKDTRQGPVITSVFDFGLAYANPSLFDLAQLIERHAIDWLTITEGIENAWRPQVVRDLLDGYVSQYPLMREEARMLAPMVAVSNTEFELAVIEYDQRAPIPGRTSDWAYTIGMDAHHRWFTTESGTQFIRTVTQLAIERS